MTPATHPGAVGPVQATLAVIVVMGLEFVEGVGVVVRLKVFAAVMSLPVIGLLGAMGVDMAVGVRVLVDVLVHVFMRMHAIAVRVGVGVNMAMRVDVGVTMLVNMPRRHGEAPFLHPTMWMCPS